MQAQSATIIKAAIPIRTNAISLCRFSLLSTSRSRLIGKPCNVSLNG
ncbi:hypothetical protein SCARR_05289 [Pontiella sulfatireligans]|uniref:Uncharacterized protein n=1 Tax=Pontiella sulfatireligans TaxID=2750658 RepID=A0A6C2UVH9_9BACT|nr:hypothetical protein SCARR_05289 [Pontiella sulfatireligans]